MFTTVLAMLALAYHVSRWNLPGRDWRQYLREGRWLILLALVMLVIAVATKAHAAGIMQPPVALGGLFAAVGLLGYQHGWSKGSRWALQRWQSATRSTMATRILGVLAVALLLPVASYAGTRSCRPAPVCRVTYAPAGCRPAGAMYSPWAAPLYAGVHVAPAVALYSPYTAILPATRSCRPAAALYSPYTAVLPATRSCRPAAALYSPYTQPLLATRSCRRAATYYPQD